MRLGRGFRFTSVSLVLLLAPIQAWACACCAEEGQYRITVSRPSEYTLALMKQMRLGPTANLFTGMAELEEAARGLAHPVEKYSLSGLLADRAWRLAFRDGSNLGSLNLMMPARFLSYGADIHDGKNGGGGGPLLYKEWRFEGLVNGTGVFRGGLTAPAKYFLVFQGRGNNCDNAEDFSHWRLEINGRKAKYAFYGEFAAANP